jgi:hypothetical protein
LMTKNWNKFTAGKNLIFFWSEIAIYLSLGPHKGSSSYRRSLQLTKENIQRFKTFLWVIFALLDPILDPDPLTCESGSNPDPEPKTLM